jgi:hypothetical protein
MSRFRQYHGGLVPKLGPSAAAHLYLTDRTLIGREKHGLYLTRLAVRM